MRVMEAKAVISAADKTGGTFAAVAQKIRRLEAAGVQANRRAAQSAGIAASAASRVAGAGVSAMAALGRYAAPAAIAAGTVAATKNFAAFDRQLTYLGNTAEASGEQMAAVRKEITETATIVAESPEDVLKATNAYVTAGQSLEVAAKATRETAITSKAFGSDMEETARAGTAAIQNMGIRVENLGRAFDIMAEGAKVGQFEFKDMAKEMPSILAAAQGLGEQGEKALGRIVASLEVVRSATGDSSTAANDYYNLLQKIIAPETLKNFKKAGVDLQKELVQAKEKGESMIDAFLRIAQRESKGDPFKLKALVGDMRANRALTALLSNLRELDGMTERVLGASGNRLGAFNSVMSDQQAPLDQLSASWDRFVKSVGAFAAIPLAPAFGALADGIERTRQLLTSPEAREKAAKDQASGDAEFWAKAHLAEAQGRESLAQSGDKRRIEEIDRKIAKIEAGPYMRLPNSSWRGPNAEERRRIDALKKERDQLTGRGSDRLQAQRLERFNREQAMDNLLRPPPPDLNIPVPPGGVSAVGPADRDDRMGQRALRLPPPLPPPNPLRGKTYLPPVGDDAGGSVKAVVEGPITAQVSGQADVQVTVKVEPSPQFLATVDRLEKAAAMPLRSAPTGRSMPEAEPSSGRSGGIGSR